ncbi:hypothetical protein D9619_004543 [Psilocybe cf. subviscida]|uniref:Polycystin cation channel PKD1/PKD2 domain-containing protein n=1 Tax=Psilocybe cf. subviscida TaxID=2480587 RepID=A0A8H5F804_9AGAR|nr:hypothetical protein D9619_004543 [Psilocybe cf. subviscida]
MTLLTAADINFAVVRPIVLRYARLKNMSVVYACLVVRSYFLAAAETDLAFANVMVARANLCEILALKLLHTFAQNYFQLVAVLTATWNPLAGASDSVVEEVKHTLNMDDDDIDMAQSAIEVRSTEWQQMAISTQAKAFLASPLAQQVVNDIYAGKVVFSLTANRSILADNYKTRGIEIYNPHSAPFINHYRLRVPKYGTYLGFLNFSLLLFTFMMCLAKQDRNHVTPWEVAFMILGSAFALEEYTAATEHGWIIYIANMWNAFDFAFILVFLTYFFMRLKGLSSGHGCREQRLICWFNRSLRAMISQFVLFIGIAAVCFSGLLFTLWTLASGDPEGKARWTFKSIAWLMVQIWFGNTYLSFAQATSFHPFFGPILMTAFAALSNTLLLTILISILSNTVARIDSYLFQFTIATIEGVKSDALFSYQPPFNILAFVLLKPASWFLSPRALHSMNVFLIKVTSLPQLIVIGLYERHWSPGRNFRQTSKDAAQSFFNSLPRHIKNMPLIEAIVGSSSNDLYDAIFDVDVDEGEYDIFADMDGTSDRGPLRSIDSRENVRPRAGSGSPVPDIRARRPTSTTRPGSGRAASARGSSKQRVLGPNSLTPIVPSAGDRVAFPVETSAFPESNRSPLTRFFGSRFPSMSGVAPPMEESKSAAAVQAAALSAANTEASVRHIESLLQVVSDLPVQKLKEEMKELQERQARIENLLLMLTRGMRNETTTTSASRQSSLA